MAYAENTEVPVPKTRAEIELLIMKHACTQFIVGVDHAQHRATVQFHAHQRIVRFEIALPDPADPKYRTFRNAGSGVLYRRTPAQVEKHVAQLERTRWRALLLVIKAKLEAVESGITTFEDEFLAHVVLPNQQTVADYMRPSVEQMYMTGVMPPSRQLTGGEGRVVDGVAVAAE